MAFLPTKRDDYKRIANYLSWVWLLGSYSSLVRWDCCSCDFELKWVWTTIVHSYQLTAVLRILIKINFFFSWDWDRRRLINIGRVNMHLICILQITKSAWSLLFTRSTCYWMALIKVWLFYLPVISEWLMRETKSRFAIDSCLLLMEGIKILVLELVDVLWKCLSIGSFRLWLRRSSECWY